MKALYDDPDKVPSSLPRIPVARLKGHDGPVQAISFTNDGKYCLTGGHDRTVRLWNPLRIDPQYTETLMGGKGSTGGDDGTGGNQRVPTKTVSEQQHDVDFGDLPPALEIQTYVSGYSYDVSAVCVTEEQQTLLAASGKVLVVTDLVTKQLKRKLQQHHTGRINAIAAPPGGEVYLTASYDSTVAIWDGRSWNSKKPIQILKEAKDSVTDIHVAVERGEGALASGADNTALIYTASVDGFVYTYDIRKGIMKKDNFENPITSMALTKDGQCLVVSCLDGTIRLMDSSTGELVNTYTSSHKAGNFGLKVDILANDNYVAIGSEDGACAIYDLVRAIPVQRLEGPVRPTIVIAANPKRSAMVISASYDNSTCVWDAVPI
jgi:mitogen-activated protein kinase organizer 1